MFQKANEQYDMRTNFVFICNGHDLLGTFLQHLDLFGRQTNFLGFFLHLFLRFLVTAFMFSRELFANFGAHTHSHGTAQNVKNFTLGNAAILRLVTQGKRSSQFVPLGAKLRNSAEQ